MCKELQWIAAALVGAALAVAPADAWSQEPETVDYHYVRLPAGSAADLARLNLPSSTTIDYGGFLWVELSPEDYARLQASGLEYREEVDAFTLRLGEQSFDPLKDSAVGGTSLRGRDGAPAPGPDLHLVQVIGPTRTEWLEALRADGLEIVQYIHPHTYVVWGETGALDVAARREHVRWAGSFAPAYRLLPRYRNLPDQVDQVRVLMYRGADTAAVVRGLEALGGKVHGRRKLNAVFALAEMDISTARLAEVADIPGVYSVQIVPRDGGLRGEMSDQVNVNNVDGSNQAFPGYPAWLAGVGLDGSGVIIANVDGGVQDSHPDLVNRLVGCSGTTCGGGASSSHGTHTAGIMAADGTSGTLDSYGFLRGLGVAPGASLVEQVYSPWFQQPGGMLLLMTDSYNNGASLSGNSWGPAGSPLGYDNDTLQVDIGVRDADPNAPGNQPLTYVLSIMNGYGGTSTQGTPDEAKNIFTIGSTKMQTSGGAQILQIDDLSSNTAHGPALDGRTIPHMVAPGCYVDSTTSGSGYTTMCGTSMASPHVSGAVALFIEYYRGLPNYTTDPSPALVKAAFLPAARDLAGNQDADGGTLGHPFDSKQGWGRMDLEAVVDPQLTVRYFDNPLVFDNTGEQWNLTVAALDPAQPLRIMLVWTDAPGHGLGGSTPAWNNNLDLMVQSGASTYRGNNFGPNGWSIDGGTADSMNNTEGVFVGPTAPGSYDITVLAADINSDAIPGVGDATDQDFALVCYNCAEQPGFTLSATPAELDLCVPDDALYNVEVGSIMGFSNPITLTASGQPAGTTVNFSPNPVTPPGSSVMTVSNTGAAAGGSYDINIQGEDPITADIKSTSVGLTVYTAVPGAVTLNSPPDGAIDQPLTPTTFDWSAADQATSYQLQLASDLGFANLVFETTLSETSYTLDLPLDSGTQYFWHVAPANFCGDGSFSATYSFTTRVVPDFFTEQFTFAAPLDLADTTLVFTPNATVDFYAACAEPITALPTDPAGGTPLNLPNNSYATVNLTGGDTVWLYGVSYGTVYVGSNGYITFAGGDTDNGESLGDHFSQPRISALFDFLSPQNGGTVSWQQLADRLAVTYQNVPEYPTTGSNTFQIEMHFDGTITLSYLSLTADDAVVGLSEGNGLDPDFLPTDLSALGNCGPQPPVALDADLSTPANTPLLITLPANDDGLPDPPAALVYIITALPTNGTLSDPGAGAIDTAPYTLAGGGNQVSYTPQTNYMGTDQFSFKVNDGGTPPEGGDSNEATVSLTVGVPSLLYQFTMDQDPAWTAEGAWAFGVPTGGGSHDGDPTGGYTGDNVYGYNLDGDYTNGMTDTFLTTGALNCSNVTATELRFWKWLGVESAPFDKAKVQVSNDGSTWVTVWENGAGDLSDTSWSQMVLDLSAVADHQPTVYLRWGMGPTDSTTTFPGWNLDDVELWGLVPLSGQTPGDIDGDGDVDLGDFSTFANCYRGPAVTLPPPSCTPTEFEACDLDDDSDVDLSDFATFANNYTG